MQLGWAAAVCQPQLSALELPVCDWTKTEVESSKGVDMHKKKAYNLDIFLSEKILKDPFSGSSGH